MVEKVDASRYTIDVTVSLAISCSDGRVVLGGDSFCGGESIADRCVEPKVYTSGPVGFCVAGEIRPEQIIHVTLDAMVSHRLKKSKKKITLEWIRGYLVDGIRANLRANGTLGEREGVQFIPNSDFLLCFSGKIYKFAEDFSMWESQSSFAAIGAARELAYGALSYAIGEDKPSHKEALAISNRVLSVCSEWSPWVCPPFKITTLKRY